MANFNNYELDGLRSEQSGFGGVYDLADGVIREIAEAASFDLGHEPSVVALQGLIGRLGPDKELQKNIGLVKEFLGDDATDRAAKWVERSGILEPMSRAFRSDIGLPAQVDVLVMPGGVANWMLRRRKLIEGLDPELVRDGPGVVLPLGNRVMGVGEHQLVKSHARYVDRPITEAEFGEFYIDPVIDNAFFGVETLAFDTSNGDEVMDGLFERMPQILGGTILAVGNAPSVIQSAGQLREAAQRINPDFDEGDSPQLFMMGDGIPVARFGEPKATHQDPLTALGAMVRDARYLQYAVENSPSS